MVIIIVIIIIIIIIIIWTPVQSYACPCIKRYQSVVRCALNTEDFISKQFL
jgi:hypothetical protein